MFDDTQKKKIFMFIMPILIYLGVGMIAEVLGILVYVLFLRDRSLTAPFSIFEGVEYIHQNGEIYLLIFRSFFSGILFILMYQKDKKRIGNELYTQRSLKEKPEFFSAKASDIKTLPLVILCGIGFSVTVNLIFQLSGLSSAHSVLSQNASVNYKGMYLFTLILLDCFIAPVSEEFMNRGLIYKRLRTYQTVIVSELCACLIFSLLHGDVIAAVYAFFFGLLLAEIYENTRGLHYSILCHASANISSVILALYAPLNRMISLNRIVFLIIGIVLFLTGRIGIALYTGKGKRDYESL